MTPGEKALTLSYLHAEMLISNLDITIHEMKVNNVAGANQLLDKLIKLRAASSNVFRKVSSAIEDEGQLNLLREDLERLLDEAWSI